MKKIAFILVIVWVSMACHAQQVIEVGGFSDDDDDNFGWEFREDDNFDIHWQGFEIGLNNFLSPDNSFVLSDEHSYLELHTGKSWNVNLNLIELDFGLIGDNFGLGTGLGLEFNDYRFENKLPIVKGENQVMVDSTYADPSLIIDKAKITMTHLTFPLLLEFQVPTGDSEGFFITAGVIGGLRIGAHTKTVVIEEGGDKDKQKERGDFYLNSFRYGYTARVGYGAVKIFANYYDTPLFQEGKGPQVHPFSLGFMLSF